MQTHKSWKNSGKKKETPEKRSKRVSRLRQPSIVKEEFMEVPNNSLTERVGESGLATELRKDSKRSYM